METKKNIKNQKWKSWIYLNHVLVKRQNVIKSIVLVMQQEKNVQAYVRVMIAQIVNFMNINHLPRRNH